MAHHDRTRKKEMGPRFDLVGKTLLIRVSNVWSAIDEPDHWNCMPGINKQENYERVDVHNIVVMWNVFEACVSEAGSFIWFQEELYRQFPSLVDIPCQYVLNTGTSVSNHSKVELPNTLHYIETFGLSTKLLYDLWPSWHHSVPWQPFTKQILFTPGKLRPYRYLALKKLLQHFPNNLTYVLNRNLPGEGMPTNPNQKQQLNAWVESTRNMINEFPPKTINFENEVYPFMLKYENNLIDTVQLNINNYTQLLGYRLLETTSISVVVETNPGDNFFTEKTYACIVSGRPFIHFSKQHNTEYLEQLGYKLFYNHSNTDYYSMNLWLENFLISPDVDTIKETIQHNLNTLESNVAEHHKTMTSIMPEWPTLPTQSQVDILTTFLKINT